MNKIACQYAIVRFAPFVETGEFANVGIVMMAPKQRYFGFELELKRFARITHFFNDIDAKLYKKALNNLKDELERVNDVFNAHEFDNRLKHNDADFAHALFHEVTRKREAIVRFGNVRTVLTDAPDKKLKELFAFYIERNFITRKYQEELLERNMRKFLIQINVGDRFDKEKIGDDNYHATFPFVRHENNQRIKIIKPLHLGHNEPTKIYEHGAAWIYRINKLKNKFFDPQQVLFTLAGPEAEQDKNRLDAYLDIQNELQRTGIRIADYDNKDEISQFALN